MTRSMNTDARDEDWVVYAFGEARKTVKFNICILRFRYSIIVYLNLIESQLNDKEAFFAGIGRSGCHEYNCSNTEPGSALFF